MSLTAAVLKVRMAGSGVTMKDMSHDEISVTSEAYNTHFTWWLNEKLHPVAHRGMQDSVPWVRSIAYFQVDLLLELKGIGCRWE
jgi:hypothetical protein